MPRLTLSELCWLLEDAQGDNLSEEDEVATYAYHRTLTPLERLRLARQGLL